MPGYVEDHRMGTPKFGHLCASMQTSNTLLLPHPKIHPYACGPSRGAQKTNQETPLEPFGKMPAYSPQIYNRTSLINSRID